MGRHGVGLGALVCLGIGIAHADRGPDVAALRAELEAGDPTAAARLAAAKADDVLLDALALGLPPAVAQAAIDAVAPSAKAEPVLLGCARARDAGVRAHAFAALGSGPAVVAALGDPDPGVRAAAGAALAAHHDARAVAPLLVLLRRGDAVAVAPLAALASAETARQLAELAGQVPDALLAQTLGALLLRRDLGPDTVSTSLVRALGSLPGADALAALKAYADAGPARASRREAEQLYLRRGGGQ